MNITKYLCRFLNLCHRCFLANVHALHDCGVSSKENVLTFHNIRIDSFRGVPWRFRLIPTILGR